LNNSTDDGCPLPGDLHFDRIAEFERLNVKLKLTVLAAKAISELTEDYKENPLSGSSEGVTAAIARDAMNRLILKQMENDILSGKCPTVGRA
jgi:hypothetical protein